MSFLANVLSSAEKVELEEINKKVPELKLIVENLKSDIVRFTENVYVKYSFRPKQNKELLRKAYSIEDEIKLLKKNADTASKKHLVKAGRELEEHVNSLETINISIQIVSKVCEVNEKLMQFEVLFDANQYLKCAILLDELKKLCEIPDEERLDVIDKLVSNISTKKNMLSNVLKNIFSKHVIIENHQNNRVVLEIRKESADDFAAALLALFYYTLVDGSLVTFSKSLWNLFLEPAIMNQVKISTGEYDHSHYIQITIQDHNAKSSYLEVFGNLKTILNFLKQHFNFKLKENLDTLEYIGTSIGDDLSQLIIKQCLEDTIPATTEGLQNYQQVIDDTKSMEMMLRECKILNGGASCSASIVDYVNDIDWLFIEKKCKEYLVVAQQIMEKDMHDLVQVGVAYNPDNPLAVCNNEIFLQCSVSKSAVELLAVTKKIVQQAVNAADNNNNKCAEHLLSTMQIIVRRYGKYVPEFHKKVLQTIPQQVALFHNNCLYISHNLLEWNKVYCPKMPSKNCVVFLEEAHHLQGIAAETFGNYVKGQTRQINDIMKDSGLVDGGGTLGDLPPVTEKCVRQCLRQQELLKTVWQKVLSYTVYNQTLGVILNTLCVCITTSIVKYEDISSSAAKQLVEIINIVLNRGPKLFTDPKEVTLYVSSWYKLNELNFVLSASLLDINDRWADGKGPLAMQFAPIELKSLIRALFQNTDRRAAVLAKIL